ncbi:unnamed protein product [Phytomonas sp. EM1]|nr:unnamed protein product [Phytomonas sp. EM1]|eukprot:CCW63543.1 unnamed protein product [Phytomonas sp. isolate EM1]
MIELWLLVCVLGLVFRCVCFFSLQHENYHQNDTLCAEYEICYIASISKHHHDIRQYKVVIFFS